jgi:hypothetical protein
MSATIEKLEKEVGKIKKENTTPVNELKSAEYKCTECDYEAASSTALKSHVTKKHKPEILRSSGPEEDSRHLSPEKDTPRAADPSTTLESKCTTVPSTMENMCNICNKYFDESSAFKTHSFSEDVNMCLDCPGTSDLSPELCYWVTTNQTIAGVCVACWDANTCYE